MRDYIITLMKICFSAVILGEATIMLLMDRYAKGCYDVCLSVFPELYISVIAATTVTAAGILLLYYIKKSY